MIDIPIPASIEIGGFTYRIDTSEEANKDLFQRGSEGTCSGQERCIRLKTRFVSEQELTNTFTHELLHSVGQVYLNDKLTEKQVSGLANGLHQIFNQLGIRFCLEMGHDELSP